MKRIIACLLLGLPALTAPSAAGPPTDLKKDGAFGFPQDKATVLCDNKDLRVSPVRDVLGTGSELAAEYGVSGLPHAFIVGRDGKLAWHGNPNGEEFDKELSTALGAK